MLGGAQIPSTSEESRVGTECGSGSPSSEDPGCIGTEGGKQSVGSPHGARCLVDTSSANHPGSVCGHNASLPQ